MGITVSDIERKEFAYKGAGYDPYDVDQYLDQICDEMVAMQDHIAQLEKELEEAYREVEKAKHAAKPVQQDVYAKPVPNEEPKEVAPVTKTSETLEAILVNAQKLADDAVENANKKAEETVLKAKQEATDITDEAVKEKKRIEDEYEALRQSAQKFKENFLSILQEHKALLDKSALMKES